MTHEEVKALMEEMGLPYAYDHFAEGDRTVGSERADGGGIQKKPRKSEREMTTPLFLLRCVQLGISIADLDLLTIGLVNDMFTERQNDEYPYKELASQEDFDRF